MDIKKECIFITGAGGFVGACLTRCLVDMGIKPHVLVQPKTDLWRLSDIRANIFVYEGDLTDAVFLSGIIHSIRPTIIYHFAAHGAYASQMDANRIMTTNILGTLNLLQALEVVDYKIFVNTGSSSEYGFKSQSMRETDVPVPNSFYAVSKASQTMLCQYMAMAQKKNIVTLRLFSVYGPYEEPTRLVPTIIRLSLHGKDLTMATPEVARDFIFVDDVIDAYLNVESLMKASGEILNIGSGVEVTLKEITDLVLELTQSKVRVQWGGMPNRSWDTSIWVGDITKARTLLGFSSRTTLKQGLTKTITWMKKHG